MIESLSFVLLGIAWLAGILFWIQEEFGLRRRFFHFVGSDVYRVLERARDRLFNGTRTIRLTVFQPDPTDAQVLRPVARLGWGRTVASSTVRFMKGEGLAGKAWERDVPFLVYNTAASPDDARARILHQHMFNLRPETAKGLSQEQLSVRKMVATSLNDSAGCFKGILCIDVPKEASQYLPSPDDAEAFNAFWRRLARISTELAAKLESPVRPTAKEKVLTEEEGAALATVSLAV